MLHLSNSKATNELIIIWYIYSISISFHKNITFNSFIHISVNLLPKHDSSRYFCLNFTENVKLIHMKLLFWIWVMDSFFFFKKTMFYFLYVWLFSNSSISVTINLMHIIRKRWKASNSRLLQFKFDQNRTEDVRSVHN